VSGPMDFTRRAAGVVLASWAVFAAAGATRAIGSTLEPTAAGGAVVATGRAIDLGDEVARLGSPEAADRDAALESLREAGATAAEALLDGLDAPSTLARAACASLLGELRDSQFGPALAEKVRSDDFTIVRRRAAIALARSGHRDGRTVLGEYLLVDPVGGAEAIGIAGYRELIPEMVAVLVDAHDNLTALQKLRGRDRERGVAQEGRLSGDIVVIAGGVMRLGCRGGVGPLLDAAKFTEWVGVYARHRMKEYLGESMPRMTPPAREGENFDVVKVAGSMAYFWDTHNAFYVSPSSSDEASPELRRKIEALAAGIPSRTGSQLRRLVEILVAIGPLALPPLFDAYAEEGSDTYLHPTIERVVYEMCASPRRSRPIRGSRRVQTPLIERIDAETIPEVRAGWIALLGELLHWYPYRMAVENAATSYPVDAYAETAKVREEGKQKLLELIESDAPSDQIAALDAYIRVGGAEVVEPASLALAGSDDPRVQVAAARCLGWVREDESGLAALQASDYQSGEYSEPVRLAVARSLALLGEEDPVPVLLEALRSSDEPIRQQAVDALRTVAARYYGFDPAGPEAARDAAADRWDAWWADAEGAFRIDFERVRESEFNLFNHPLQDRFAMLDAIEDCENESDPGQKLRLFKGFYLYQRKCLPLLIERFESLEDDSKLFFGNLIAGRYDKRLGLPFLLDRLEVESDPFRLVSILDSIGQLAELGLDEMEIELLSEELRKAFERTEHPLVRLEASLASARLGDVRGIPFLIECLGFDETSGVENAAWLRDEAIEALKEITRKAGRRRDFDYQPQGPRVRREESIEAWRRWWESEGGSLSLPSPAK